MEEETYQEIGLTDSDRMLMDQEQIMDSKAMQLVDNPFDQQQYQGIKGSDAPIQYSGGMAELLLSDDEVPEIFRKKYWFVFNKDNKLTFLTPETKIQKMLGYDIAVIDMLNSMNTYYDYTFDQEQQYNLIRGAFDTKLDRSLGITGNVKNERIILQSQFTENKNINESGGQGPIKEGFFRRLLGRR